jgi:DNA uptake protein ComE-like DNA-binding protein
MTRLAARWALLALVAGCTLPGQAHELDVNQASAKELARLPGISAADAQRIVANRPYYQPEDILQRAVLTPAQYDRIRDRLVFGPPAMPGYLDWVPPEP